MKASVLLICASASLGGCATLQSDPLVSAWPDAPRPVSCSGDAAASKADLCAALAATADEASAYNTVAQKLVDSDARASGLRLFAAATGVALLGFHPKNTDNIAATVLLGGSAEAWRNGLRPRERSVIYQTAALRLACVVKRGGAFTAFYPVDTMLDEALTAARSEVLEASTAIDSAGAQPVTADQKPAFDAMLARLQRARDARHTLADDLAAALSARQLSAQLVYDTAGVIRRSAADQINGVPFNADAVVELLNKLPETLPNKPPANQASPSVPVAPPPSGAGDTNARIAANRATAAVRDRQAVSLEKLRANAAMLEAATARDRGLLTNSDGAKYKAVGACATA